MPYNNQPRSHSKEKSPGKSSLYNNLLFACAIFLVFTLGIKQKLFMAAKKRSILYTFWWRVSSRVPIKKKGTNTSEMNPTVKTVEPCP